MKKKAINIKLLDLPNSVSADRTNLKPVLEAVRSYSGQLGLSQISNQTFLFWVEDSDSPGCDALFLQHTAGWDFTVGYVQLFA